MKEVPSNSQKSENERYIAIRIMSVCNIISIVICIPLLAFFEEKKFNWGWLLTIFLLAFEIYEALYYKNSSEEVKKG